MSQEHRVDWSDIEAIVRALPARHNLVIPKSAASNPPPHAESWMGRRRGAIRQYRDERPRSSLHVKEYADRWIVHVDLWNPHHHMARHLAVDRGYTRFIHLLHWFEHGHRAAEHAQPFAQALA